MHKRYSPADARTGGARRGGAVKENASGRASDVPWAPVCPNHDRKPGGRCGCQLVVQASRGQWRALPAGASLDEAKRALAKLRAERSGRPGPRSAAPLTVGELAALSFESRLHLEPSTRRADAQLFLSHLAPVFGDLPLRQVRRCRAHVGDAAARRGGPHLFVSKSVWLLRRLLAWAADR